MRCGRARRVVLALMIAVVAWVASAGAGVACAPPGCVPGQFPDASWAPYAPDSSFNQVFLADAAIAVNSGSAAIVSDLISDTLTPPAGTKPTRQTPANFAISKGGRLGWTTYYVNGASAAAPLVEFDCDPNVDPSNSTGDCPAA